MSDVVAYVDPADLAGVGMEDFDAGDFKVPRLRIDHTKAVFVDENSNEEWAELNAIILGVPKARVLWSTDPDDDQGPLCKSVDHKIGMPSLKPGRFPEKAATGVLSLTDGKLDCASCPLKEWGSHPQRDKVPWCTEQYILVLLVLDGDGGWSPALLNLQRSQLTPAKKYISSFAQKKSPMFTHHTSIKLEANRKGKVDYATPLFTKGSETDNGDWNDFANQYRSIREFLTTVRPTDSESTTEAAPEAAKVAPKPAPMPEPVAAAATTDDDLPF